MKHLVPTALITGLIAAGILFSEPGVRAQRLPSIPARDSTSSLGTVVPPQPPAIRMPSYTSPGLRDFDTSRAPGDALRIPNSARVPADTDAPSIPNSARVISDPTRQRLRDAPLGTRDDNALLDQRPRGEGVCTGGDPSLNGVGCSANWECDWGARCVGLPSRCANTGAPCISNGECTVPGLCSGGVGAVSSRRLGRTHAVGSVSHSAGSVSHGGTRGLDPVFGTWGHAPAVGSR
jgi:hypothetical protein